MESTYTCESNISLPKYLVIKSRQTRSPAPICSCGLNHEIKAREGGSVVPFLLVPLQETC